nr:NADP-dependent malic enzyme [Alphaproteobacteria bacterium]
GLLFEGRNEDSDPYKDKFKQTTGNLTIAEALVDADIFLGVSGANALKAEWIMGMARDPLIMALANPTPEIMPEDAHAARPDALVATGRSDYPNQVNNVLCFPFIFRGALDVGATTINEEMKIACARAIAALGEREAPEQIVKAYGESTPLTFGKEYFIPKPFDPRLIVELPVAVAEAAMRTGVATRPIDDMDAYRLQLSQFVNRSGMVMKPVFDQARQVKKRVLYAEGEDERVLRAVQTVIDEGIASPILCGRRELVARRIEKHGLRMRLDVDVELIDPFDHPKMADYATLYHAKTGRQGVSPAAARYAVQTRSTVLCALMLLHGDADAMVCGTSGQYNRHLRHIDQIIGAEDDVEMAALTMLVMKTGTLFLVDTHVGEHREPENVVRMVGLAAEKIGCFGITPKVAFVSHSNFGSKDSPKCRLMRESAALFRARYPDIESDGEMHADAALSPEIRRALIADSPLKDAANLLVMPDLDSANITYNALKVLGVEHDGADVVGPMLLGARRPVHIVTSSATARSVIDITAIAVVDSIRQTT